VRLVIREVTWVIR